MTLCGFRCHGRLNGTDNLVEKVYISRICPCTLSEHNALCHITSYAGRRTPCNVNLLKVDLFEHQFVLFFGFTVGAELEEIHRVAWSSRIEA